MTADNPSKRPRAEACETDAAEAANATESPAAQQPDAQKRKKPAPPPPTPILPGAFPESTAAWDNAVLLIDKPKGWTSFDVCGRLRGQVAGLLGIKNRQLKVGHAGTLDPMATGLLIVCVGRATKSIDSFVAMRKEYSGVLRLGEGTASYDAESEVTVRLPWEDLTGERQLGERDT